MRLLKKILLMLLIVSLSLFAVACDKDGDEDDTVKTGGEKTYTVEVLTPFGRPLSGVTVLVHKDGGEDYNVCKTAVTNSEGKVSLELDSSFDYSVGVMGHSKIYSSKAGATRDDRYVLGSESITITLGMSDTYVPDTYKAGDPMANFTVTDIDGAEYQLYDILQEKKVLILNFWFRGCDPCASEFPALNSAYNSYKDAVEILALNDYPSETVGMVRSYESYRGFTLDMPLFKIEYGSAASLSRFGSRSYPTTVVIDRYGVVSLVHVGAVTSESIWRSLFDYYTSDSYDGTPYTDF